MDPLVPALSESPNAARFWLAIKTAVATFEEGAGIQDVDDKTTWNAAVEACVNACAEQAKESKALADKSAEGSHSNAAYAGMALQADICANLCRALTKE